MGMFDTVEMAPGLVSCAKCRAPLSDLQTKDLGENLDTYAIDEKTFFYLKRRLGESEPALRKECRKDFSAYTSCRCGTWNEWSFVVEEDSHTFWMRTEPK